MAVLWRACIVSPNVACSSAIRRSFGDASTHCAHRASRRAPTETAAETSAKREVPLERKMSTQPDRARGGGRGAQPGSRGASRQGSAGGKPSATSDSRKVSSIRIEQAEWQPMNGRAFWCIFPHSGCEVHTCSTDQHTRTVTLSMASPYYAQQSRSFPMPECRSSAFLPPSRYLKS